MHIIWQGKYTLKIQSSDKTLLIDPHSPVSGLPVSYSRPDLVALSNPADPEMSHISHLSNEPPLLNSPGEYELGGFALHALGWYTEQGQELSLQRWHIEDMTLLHVGAMNRELTQTELQELEKTDIDVLFLPVGGKTLNLKQVVALMTTIEPRVVIPINYQVVKTEKELHSVSQFAKEVGIDASQPAEKKITLKAKKLPQDELLPILLSPSS